MCIFLQSFTLSMLRLLLALGSLVVLLPSCGASSASGITSPSPIDQTTNTNAGSENSAASPEPSLPSPTLPRPTPLSNFIPISHPRFFPKVVRAQGSAGGNLNGANGPMHCQGFYPEAPQHILKVGKTIPFLRIVVDNPSHDLTLLVRTPEGQWVCNDDSQDPSTPFNPLIDLTNLRGEVEIYVGAFERDGVGASYTLGITEDPGYYGSSLRGD